MWIVLDNLVSNVHTLSWFQPTASSCYMRYLIVLDLVISDISCTALPYIVFELLIVIGSVLQKTHVISLSTPKICLTHWGRVTHIYLTSIGSDNCLSPGRRQAIIRTNAGILLIRPIGTNFSEILIEILLFQFKKIRLKVSSAKSRPYCLGLNVLKNDYWRLWDRGSLCSKLVIISSWPLYSMWRSGMETELCIHIYYSVDLWKI